MQNIGTTNRVEFSCGPVSGSFERSSFSGRDAAISAIIQFGYWILTLLSKALFHEIVHWLREKRLLSDCNTESAGFSEVEPQK